MTRTAMAMDVLAFIKTAHEGQKQDDGTPYFMHPVRVAESLVHYGICEAGSDWHIAANLHDVIEDTKETYTSIKRKFGMNIADIVQELTNKHPSGTPFEVKQKALLEHASNYSLPAKYIKLADRLDNLRSCKGVWDTERVNRYVFATGELIGVLNMYHEPAARQLLGDIAETIYHM